MSILKRPATLHLVSTFPGQIMVADDSRQRLTETTERSDSTDIQCSIVNTQSGPGLPGSGVRCFSGMACNHLHMLICDGAGRDVIPRSMQLVAGRTGQECNDRKRRKGAFWEDRYHATAVEPGNGSSWDVNL